MAPFPSPSPPPPPPPPPSPPPTKKMGKKKRRKGRNIGEGRVRGTGITHIGVVAHHSRVSSPCDKTSGYAPKMVPYGSDSDGLYRIFVKIMKIVKVWKIIIT